MPAAGSITFAQAAYGYPPAGPFDSVNPPEHWLAYAMPPICGPLAGARSSTATPPTISPSGYGTRILYRTLTIGVGYFISLLTAIEPAFRATGHARQQVADLARHSRFSSPPGAARSSSPTSTSSCRRLPSGPDLPHTPLQNPGKPLKTRGIPLGVADPVSGLAAFVPVWSEGFVFAGPRHTIRSRARSSTALSRAPDRSTPRRRGEGHGGGLRHPRA